MDAALYTMAYFSLHHNLHLCMTQTYSDNNNDQSQVMDCKKFYGNVKETIPPYTPKPLGKPAHMHMIIGSNHTGYK